MSTSAVASPAANSYTDRSTNVVIEMSQPLRVITLAPTQAPIQAPAHNYTVVRQEESSCPRNTLYFTCGIILLLGIILGGTGVFDSIIDGDRTKAVALGVAGGLFIDTIVVGLALCRFGDRI